MDFNDNMPPHTMEDVPYLVAIKKLNAALNHPVIRMKYLEWYCEKILIASLRRKPHAKNDPLFRYWVETRDTYMHRASQVWGLDASRRRERWRSYFDQEKVLAEGYELIFKSAWKHRDIPRKINKALEDGLIMTPPVFCYVRGPEQQHRMYPMFRDDGQLIPDARTRQKLKTHQLTIEEIEDMINTIERTQRLWPIGKPIAFTAA